MSDLSYSQLKASNPEVATLDELLKEIQDRDIVINLDCAEPKRLSLKQLLKTLKEVQQYRLENKVYIEIPKKRFLACLLFNRHLVYELVFDELNWKYNFFKPFFYWAWHIIVLNRQPNTNNVRKVHENGCKISYWTASSLEEASQYIEMGYDIVGVNRFEVNE